MSIGGHSCITMAIFVSFYRDIKTTTVACKFPFTEAKSDAEFYLNFSLQWTIFIHAILLYFGIETMMTMFENFILVAPKLIHLGFGESISVYEAKEFAESQLRFAFRNTLIQCSDYDR